MNYDTLATQDMIDTLVKNAPEKGYEVLVVETGAEALAKIKELIPAGATVMNGSSTTLDQIGYINYLKSGTHPWINPKDAILNETDKAKQTELRKRSVVSDWYLGSVHGIAETGEMIWGSASGSQLPHIAFTSQNLIFVAGTHKIVPTLTDALQRMHEYVIPLEDKRMKSTGAPGTKLNKTLIWHGDAAFLGRKNLLILVKEKLGF